MFDSKWLKKKEKKKKKEIRELGTADVTWNVNCLLYSFVHLKINCYFDCLWGQVIQKVNGRLSSSSEYHYLEMHVPSQGHYGLHSFPVVDWFCLFI
jgi:hypothetical protein